MSRIMTAAGAGAWPTALFRPAVPGRLPSSSFTAVAAQVPVSVELHEYKPLRAGIDVFGTTLIAIFFAGTDDKTRIIPQNWSLIHRLCRSKKVRACPRRADTRICTNWVKIYASCGGNCGSVAAPPWGW